MESLTDGRFVYRGGIFEDQTGHMGPTAVLRIGAVDVPIASRGTYDWNGEQLVAAGLDFRQAKFLVVKNPMNFNMAFRPWSAGVFILDTPGPTPPTMKRVEFRRFDRPWFPRDPEQAGGEPWIHASPVSPGSLGTSTPGD